MSEYIDANRPDLVVNSGNLAFDGLTNRDDFEFTRTRQDALPVACRYLPGNHDVGNNPTEVGPAPSQPITQIIPDAKQELIGTEEVGLMEYRSRPDGFEVRHIRAPGQIDVDLDSLIGPASNGQGLYS